VDHGLCQQRSGGGTVAGNIVGLGGDLLHQLCAHVLKGIGQLHFLGDADAVVGDEGRKLEQKAAAQKAKETRERKKHDTELPPQDDMFARTVVQNYISRIEQAPTIIRKGEPEGGAKKLLLSWINQMIKENGYWGTSEMILKGEESGNLLTFKVLNYFDIAVQYIGMMIVYLPEYGVQYGEEVFDRLDYIKAIAEKFEDMEDWNNAWG
jgi:hypothetical protein